MQRKLLIFHRTFKKTTKTAIVTALVLVMGLAWQDALKSGIDYFLTILSLQQQAFFYKLLSAGIISLVCSIGLMRLK